MSEPARKTDFIFLPNGFGSYHVRYQSPKTGKIYAGTITDMPLIDATKNCDVPLKKDLETLKKMIKEQCKK